MARRPDVSLVMPVWRPRSAWLREAVASAVAQEGCTFELIVVDDGNDEPIADLIDTDDRICVVRIDHGGASAARNAGLDAATGRFVRFIDADDVLTPDGTGRLLAAAGARSIAHGATAVCDEDLRPTGRVIASDLRGDVSRECLLGRFEVRHVSMLLPAEIARAAGPWDVTLTVGEDRDYVQRCVELAPVEAVRDVVTHYRRHAASATGGATARDEARRGQRRVIEKHLERHPGSPHGDEALATFHDAWARRALDEREPVAFLRDATALTRLRPAASIAVWRRAGGVVKRKLSRRHRPRWGNLRRARPFSERYGYDRGTPIDRVHLDEFFTTSAADIRGAVLEVKDPAFSGRFGRDITSLDLVDVDPTNRDATLLADLGEPGSLPGASYDCIVVPQTLQYVDDPAAAVANTWQALREGGVLLVTVPSVARLEPALRDLDRWRFAPEGLRSLLERACPGGEVDVVGYGNLVTTMGYLLGLAAEELTDDELRHVDPDHPLLACGRVRRPGASTS